jgi:hypothetical protein
VVGEVEEVGEVGDVYDDDEETVGVYDGVVEDKLSMPVAFFVLLHIVDAPCDIELPKLLNVCPKESKNPPFKLRRL